MKPSILRCFCCGRPVALQTRPVRVEHVSGAMRRSIVLCSNCESEVGATWRLSWRPVDDAHPARFERTGEAGAG